MFGANVDGPHFRTANAEDIENPGIVNTRVSTKWEIAIVLHSVTEFSQSSHCCELWRAPLTEFFTTAYSTLPFAYYCIYDLTPHEFRASTELQPFYFLPYLRVERQSIGENSQTLVTVKLQTSPAINRRTRFLKHSRNETVNETLAQIQGSHWRT